MAKIQILSVKQIKLDMSAFTHVKLPKTGFTVEVKPDKSHESIIEDKKIKKSLEDISLRTYKKLLSETAQRLQKFEKLFAGMLTKGAPEKAVSKQILSLKKAMENEIPKWERSAVREVMAELNKHAKQKR